MIENLNNLEKNSIINLYDLDENGRQINIYHLKDVQLCSNSDRYPNIKFLSCGKIYNPIREKTMSLQNMDTNYTFVENKTKKTCSIPVFFFCYNFDNYYHFIYDTLPYLISHKSLKKKIPNIKLLMNYPPQAKKFYNFVNEFLCLLGIEEKDILLLEKNTLYEDVYISSSYTHDIDSNLPPRKEIFKFFGEISKKFFSKKTPKKIYISRRSWIHNNFDNIGTNYTTRRKLVVEDDLVDILQKRGFVEVFTENMTTEEKINLFQGCEQVVGAIGGGLCNVLFSRPSTKLIALTSPTFLDVNNRFKYSLSGVCTQFYDKTWHVETDFWKKYMRVFHEESGTVGEISEVYQESLVISYLNENVSGWNSSLKLNKIEVPKKQCKALDRGLNSSWSLDLNDFKNFLEMTL